METLSYFFALRPGSAFSYYTALIIIAVVTFVGAIVLAKYIKKNSGNRAMKKLFGKLPGKMKWNSITLLFLLATRFENIPYFSMRIWLYATVIWLAYLVGRHAYLLIKVYPEERAFHFRNQKRKTEEATKKEKTKTYTTSKKRK